MLRTLPSWPFHIHNGQKCIRKKLGNNENTVQVKRKAGVQCSTYSYILYDYDKHRQGVWDHAHK